MNLPFVQDCLTHETVSSALTSAMIAEIAKMLDQYGYLLPDGSEKHLVHGDFDPANILVDKVYGVYKVSGILDWGFAFSGPVGWDCC